MDATSAPAEVRARVAAGRTPITVWLFIVLSWALGWWMAFDGLHERVFGDYIRINGQLGPWAGLAQSAGIDPSRLGFTFVAVGLGLIGASFGVYLRRRWGYTAGLLLLAASLLYLGFGTPLALICIVCLLLRPTRAYLVPPLV